MLNCAIVVHTSEVHIVIVMLLLMIGGEIVARLVDIKWYMGSQFHKNLIYCL